MAAETSSTDLSILPQRSKKRRKKLFAAIAVVLGLGMALVAGEVAVRTYVAMRGWTANCYATGLVFFVPHDSAGHTLRPHLRLRSSTYDIAVNQFGCRGPEVSVTKPEDTLRIIVLGGSSVFGYLVGEGQDSCRLLEAALDDRLARRTEYIHRGQSIAECEVINAGVPGFNLTQSRLRFESDLARLKPDFVVLYLGWNDIPLLLSESPELLDRTPPAPAWSKRVLSHFALYGLVRYRLFPAETPRFAPPASAAKSVTNSGSRAFRDELQLTISSVQNSGAIPILCTQVMASSSDCEGLEAYLGADPQQVAANREIGLWLSDCIRETAQDMSVELCDCANDIPCEKSTLGDAIHLTALGHDLVAKQWLESLDGLLSKPE